MRNNEILGIEIGEPSDAPLIIPVPEEKELFEHYEFKAWDFSPRVFKAFTAGTLVAFLTVFTFGQFNLMQTRACDNGVVGQMCQVLDAVYIATVLGGKDKEWGVSDYENTRIADADITYIDVSNVEPQLEYPAGYFALANPESYAQNQDGSFTSPESGFNFPMSSGLPTVPSQGNDLLGKPAELPKINNDPLKGAVPDSPFGTSGSDSAPKIRVSPGQSRPPRQPRRSKTPKLPNESPKLPEDDALAANKDKAKAEESKDTPPVDASKLTADRINKKPLLDFAEDVVEDVDGAEKVDLKKPFAVEMSGVLATDGKLDGKKSRFTRSEGDPQMVDVAKSAIEAINNSGLLGYLKDFGVEKVNFVFVQDDKQLIAIIRADQPSEEKARTLTSGINTGIALAKMTNKDEDLKSLIDAAKLTTEGKSFVMNFVLPKDVAHKLIDKKLQESRAKKKEPNGGEATSNLSPSAK